MEDGANHVEQQPVVHGPRKQAADLLDQAIVLLAGDPDGGSSAALVRMVRTGLDAPPHDPTHLLRLGHALEDQGRFEVAAEFFQEAVKVDPSSPLAWTNLGEICRKLVRWDAALQAYDEALARDSEYLWAIAGRGEALRMLGLLDDAVTAFRSAVDRAPEHLFAVQGLAAAALSELGRHREALPVWETALRLRPESGFANDGLSRCHNELAKENP
jgi:tetratricopeptide (TPR) repeat protein